MNVHLIGDDFDFSKLSLSAPTGVQGGAYFSKLKYDGDKLIIQIPKCGTKNGIKKTGKKSYCDLKFNSDEDIVFYEWNEKFEEHIKDLIYKNKDSWFHDDLEKDDIDYNWNSLIRSYKSKFYLFRTYVERSKILNDKPKLQVFNENKELLSINDINMDSSILCILEIKGLKFTSQSFHMECVLMQIMLLDDKKLDETCLIQIKSKHVKSNPVESIQVDSKLVVNKPLEKVENIENFDDEDEEDKPNEKVLDNKEKNKKELEAVKEKKESNKVEDKVKVKDEVVDEVEDEVVDDLEDEVDDKVENNLMEEKIEDAKDSVKHLEKVQTKKDLEKTNEILEVNLELPEDLEINSMKLKKPNEVYIEMYKTAFNKAQFAKKMAMESYLESKEIKRTYMLDIDEIIDDDLEKLVKNNENREKKTNTEKIENNM